MPRRRHCPGPAWLGLGQDRGDADDPVVLIGREVAATAFLVTCEKGRRRVQAGPQDPLTQGKRDFGTDLLDQRHIHSIAGDAAAREPIT